VSVSVAVLLAGLLSTTVGGVTIDAVLVIVPSDDDAIAAVIVYVTCPPLGSVTLSLIGPLPDAVHTDPGAGTQVQLVNVTPAGGVSVKVAPATSFGPALLATIV
jgi:hypothetical protein